MSIPIQFINIDGYEMTKDLQGKKEVGYRVTTYMGKTEQKLLTYSHLKHYYGKLSRADRTGLSFPKSHLFKSSSNAKVIENRMIKLTTYLQELTARNLSKEGNDLVIEMFMLGRLPSARLIAPEKASFLHEWCAMDASSITQEIEENCSFNNEEIAKQTAKSEKEIALRHSIGKINTKSKAENMARHYEFNVRRETDNEEELRVESITPSIDNSVHHIRDGMNEKSPDSKIQSRSQDGVANLMESYSKMMTFETNLDTNEAELIETVKSWNKKRVSDVEDNKYIEKRIFERHSSWKKEDSDHHSPSTSLWRNEKTKRREPQQFFSEQNDEAKLRRKAAKYRKKMKKKLEMERLRKEIKKEVMKEMRTKKSSKRRHDSRRKSAKSNRESNSSVYSSSSSSEDDSSDSDSDSNSELDSDAEVRRERHSKRRERERRGKKNHGTRTKVGKKSLTATRGNLNHPEPMDFEEKQHELMVAAIKWVDSRER